MTALAVPATAGGPVGEATRDLPAWPVLALLWGMPAWWALGMLPFATVIMAVPMVALLMLHRRVVVVPGILPWWAFVAWMIPCALMLDSLGRLLGFGVRFAQFASIAILLLYICNATRSLTSRRLLAGLTFVWLFVIVGGYLGMLWPDVTLTATIGRLLPGALRENEYIADLVFPPLAEIQTPWGAEEPFVRPSAPFAYTNGWGAAIAILTPIAVANALLRRSRGGVLVLVGGLLASIAPAVATSNRGLFIGLAVAIAYVVLRLAGRGQWLPVLGVAALSTALVVLLTLSGFLDAITARQDTVDTTEGRGSLYEETFVRTLDSPILGYGAPRPSFTSEITVGTQGMVWNALFCFGFVGLALFAVFLVGGLLRTWAAPTPAALWMHASVVAAIAMSIFYGLDRHMLTIGIVLALLLRDKYLGAGDTTPETTVGGRTAPAPVVS